MGEMKRAIARENDERERDRFASTLVIAAAIILRAEATLGYIDAQPKGKTEIPDYVLMNWPTWLKRVGL